MFRCWTHFVLIFVNAVGHRSNFILCIWISSLLKRLPFPPLNILHCHTFSSGQFSRSVMSDSLQPHKSQHAGPPCPSPTPGVYPNSCPLSQWCHPTVSSSVVLFSSCPQPFPTSGSFQMSQLFTSGGQNTGVSASTSIFPVNTQDWFPLGWTGWISLQSKRWIANTNSRIRK